MQPATFEESEFEDALYNQLERSHLLWSPGQVLEGRLGFDRSLLVTRRRFWRWLGFHKVLRGAALSRYTWPSWWRPTGRDPNLPGFRQNLFIQAKRSLYGPNPPRAVGRLGLSGKTWAFRLNSKQQAALQLLAQKTSGRALVAYAGPVFHTRRQLLSHTVARSIVANSTFPSAVRLAGHTAWYYQRPGSVGVANPEAERVAEEPLTQRLERLASNARADDRNLTEELLVLESALSATVETAFTGRSRVISEFFQRRLLLERFAEGVSLDTATHAYLGVILAVETLGLSWFVVARGARS